MDEKQNAERIADLEKLVLHLKEMRDQYRRAWVSERDKNIKLLKQLERKQK